MSTLSPPPPSPSPRPARVLWLQVALRILAVLTALAAIILAIVVSATLHRTWFTIFISAFIAITIDTAEVTALASRYSLKLHDPIPRIHPVILIALDFCILLFSIWSFFTLFFDAWGINAPKPYNAATLDVVETWFALTIGGIHVVLMVFDCVDCCSVRRAERPGYEHRPRVQRRVRPADRSRDDLFDMEW